MARWEKFLDEYVNDGESIEDGTELIRCAKFPLAISSGMFRSCLLPFRALRRLMQSDGANRRKNRQRAKLDPFLQMTPPLQALSAGKQEIFKFGARPCYALASRMQTRRAPQGSLECNHLPRLANLLALSVGIRGKQQKLLVVGPRLFFVSSEVSRFRRSVKPVKTVRRRDQRRLVLG